MNQGLQRINLQTLLKPYKGQIQISHKDKGIPTIQSRKHEFRASQIFKKDYVDSEKCLNDLRDL